MNMHYVKGQIVDYVTVEDGRSEVPVPNRWYLRHCSPGCDARVIERLRMLDVSAWSPTVVRFIDRRTGKVAAKPHLGKRVEKPFLPGLIFIPDFELNNAVARYGVPDLGEFLKVTVSGGGRVVERGGLMREVNLIDTYTFASMTVQDMAILRGIVSGENGQRIGRGSRGKYKPGDKVYVSDGDSPLFAFAAEVQRGVDSKGRLKAFIAALMGGVSVILSETQVEPA
ncbi:transcription termination/antitermination NusG family protein [Bradyrhizobium sp. USDA 4452]